MIDEDRVSHVHDDGNHHNRHSPELVSLDEGMQLVLGDISPVERRNVVPPFVKVEIQIYIVNIWYRVLRYH